LRVDDYAERFATGQIAADIIISTWRWKQQFSPGRWYLCAEYDYVML
jgi:hypothetical protein